MAEDVTVIAGMLVKSSESLRKSAEDQDWCFWKSSPRVGGAGIADERGEAAVSEVG